MTRPIIDHPAFLPDNFFASDRMRAHVGRIRSCCGCESCKAHRARATRAKAACIRSWAMSRRAVP